jgi:hypothetical protein
MGNVVGSLNLGFAGTAAQDVRAHDGTGAGRRLVRHAVG